MDTCYCEHHKIVDVDDETFLLDNENVDVTNNCVRCRKLNSSSWLNGEVLPINGLERNATDHFDSPEDSPLLINADYSDLQNRPNEFHCHPSTTFNVDTKAWHKLIITAALCFVFMTAELIGGYVAGSLAVMTDAAHLFSDFVGFAVSILSIWIGKWPATNRMTFGYHRAEVLGAFVSVLIVWLLAGVFGVLAIIRLYKRDFVIEVDTMLYIAGAGVLINILMGAVLHGACHSHSHTSNIAHSHTENINIRAAAAHVLGDLLQSIGVLFAAVIIKIYPDFKEADPICTILFTVVVVCATLRVAKDSALLLLEASPKSINELSLELRHLSGVKHVHSLHLWTLAPGREAVAVHLAVDEYCDRENTLQLATNFIQTKLNAVSCTIQIELYKPETVNGCKQCGLLN